MPGPSSPDPRPSVSPEAATGAVDRAAAAHRRGFAGLLALVTLAFLALLTPLFGPVLWATAITLLFHPLHRALARRTGLAANPAAALSLVAIVLTAVLPSLLVASLLTSEASALLARMNAEELEIAAIARRLAALLRGLAAGWPGTAGLADPAQLQTWLAGSLATTLRSLVASAPGLGQAAFGYLIDLAVMLYLAFFLLRDGTAIAATVERALPLPPRVRHVLLAELVTVVRATLKSSLVIAVLQGTIGGLVFALLGIRAPVLWGTAMGFMSLIPTVGTGVIWVPVAAYLLATGALWQGLALVACGLFVIGTVDNLVRPILIGRSSHIPNVTVFLATIGALGLFGVNGIIVGPLVACLFTVAWRIRQTPAPDEA